MFNHFQSLFVSLTNYTGFWWFLAVEISLFLLNVLRLFCSEGSRKRVVPLAPLLLFFFVILNRRLRWIFSTNNNAHEEKLLHGKKWEKKCAGTHCSDFLRPVKMEIAVPILHITVIKWPICFFSSSFYWRNRALSTYFRSSQQC